MKNPARGLMAIGVAFLAIGVSSNKAFIGVGAIFLMIGFIRSVREKRNSRDNSSN